MLSTSGYIFNESKKYFTSNTVKTKNDKHIKYKIQYKIKIPLLNKISSIPVISHIFIKKIKNRRKNKYIAIIQINSSKVCLDKLVNVYNEENEENEHTQKNVELFRYEKKLDNYSEEKINEFLLECKIIIENLKFDKLSGQFEIFNQAYTNPKKIGLDIFDLNYSTCEDCVVCYEMTYTKTTCSHYLCIECWSNLKKDICPICRDYLLMKNEEYQSESDDDFSNYDM